MGTSSPPRYRSIKVSSSLSEMMPSMSSPGHLPRRPVPPLSPPGPRAVVPRGCTPTPSRKQPEHSGNSVRGADRQMKGKDRIAEGGPAFGQDGIVVRPGMVKPADDHGPGHANALAFTPQGGGSGVDAVNGRHYEQSRIRGTQPRAQLSHEIGVARGVEKVHFDVVEDQGRRGQPDGSLLVDGRRLRVAHGGAIHDRTHAVHHPAA
ncbi:hypothetical protein AHiyo8_62050 [Arthrobacter sp. Hiyo8]|nr:hypothetical protein AHiyo8_62050 [Arthrobacter sp. Hiyo8]